MLPILNLDEARFECTFGRGCDGICCRNGRPPVELDEVERINSHLPRILPLLRPAARELIKRGGIVSRRRRFELPLMRVVEGWCVFFNAGCVLHELGAGEGDRFAYKPSACASFRWKPMNVASGTCVRRVIGGRSGTCHASIPQAVACPQRSRCATKSRWPSGL